MSVSSCERENGNRITKREKKWLIVYSLVRGVDPDGLEYDDAGSNSVCIDFAISMRYASCWILQYFQGVVGAS